MATPASSTIGTPGGLLVKPQPFDQFFFLALTQAIGATGSNAFVSGPTPLAIRN